MHAFLENARKAILDLQSSIDLFREQVDRTVPNRQLPEKRLRKLGELAREAHRAVVPLLDSLTLIELTALDVVDMETRMMGQTKVLAGALSNVGDEVHEQHFIRVEFEDALVRIEEEAQEVAGALFPSGVQGLNLVNSRLWEFSRLQMVLYRRTLERIALQERLTANEQKEVESTFQQLEERFDDANRFLNQLAQRELTRHGVIARKANVKKSLQAAEELAGKASNRKVFRDFKSILNETRKVAGRVTRDLDALRIPLFPPHDEMEDLREKIDAELYASLSGLQAFALVNIGARMRSIQSQGGHLLGPDLGIRIWKVFPDRIYFDVDSRFLDLVRGTGEFEIANPALHRFRDGSFKQTTFPEGNLQISFAKTADGRLNVDADIDLYRNPLAHFFGEVLVNHLTGSKTDPYRVRNILDRQGVLPIGGFEIYPA